jgi:hypothetical protein
VTANTLLMGKLRIVIDMKVDPADEEAIVRCIESRRFSAARVDFVNDEHTQSDYLSKQEKLVAIAAKLEGIRDLVIDGAKTSKVLETLQLACRLLPQAKICKIMFDNRYDDYRISHDYPSFHDDRLPAEIFQLAKCDLLTDLQLKNCNSFPARVLQESKNLKRLTIKAEFFEPDDFIINGTSVWKLVTFKLEYFSKISLCIEEPEIYEFLNEFLPNQTDLREISIAGFNFKLLLELQPNIEIVNVDDQDFQLDGIPFEQFHKFRMMEKDDPDVMMSNSLYGPNDPDDINEFEAKILAFLDRDTTIPGIKNGQTFYSLFIGSSRWIRDGTTVSDEFILNAIAKMPNIGKIEIRMAKTTEEIKRTVDRSGKNLKMWITGTDTYRFFNRVGAENNFNNQEQN